MKSLALILLTITLAGTDHVIFTTEPYPTQPSYITEEHSLLKSVYAISVAHLVIVVLIAVLSLGMFYTLCRSKRGKPRYSVLIKVIHRPTTEPFPEDAP